MFGFNQMMELVPKKRKKSNKTLLAHDKIMITVSTKSSNEQKNNFPYHQRKLNASLNIFHEENTNFYY